MNITLEKIDNLNAVLGIKVEKDDYEQKVINILNDYRKKARIDGFRPGKVPFGLIKKMYRKPVMVEEINKIVSESISKYLADQKLHILGEPLPHKDETFSIDWDTDEVFEFKFDLGIAPEFEVKVTAKDKYPFYLIKLDNELINKYTDNYAQRFGDFYQVDTPDEKDIIKAEIRQLDENNEVLPEGIYVDEATLSIEMIKDDTIRKRVLGCRKGDSIIIDLRKAYPNDAELAGILKIDHKNAGAVDGNFSIIIKEISRFKAAEINRELFDKVYGPDTIKSKEEFLAKIAEEAKNHLRQESEYRFRIDAKEILVKKTKFSLPEEFLKRWLLEINEGKFTREQINEDFARFEEDLRWQLIKDKIMDDNKIDVTDDDMILTAKEYARMQFRQYGMYNVPDEHLEQFVQKMFEKANDRNNIKSKVVENKVIGFVRNLVKIDEKEISSDKFNKLFEK